jgi:hypothetical protein
MVDLAPGNSSPNVLFDADEKRLGKSGGQRIFIYTNE